MKYQKKLYVVLLSCLLGLSVSSSLNNPTHAQDDNPLKIEKVIGLSTIPGTFRLPTAIAIAKDGSIFIADSGESQIEVYDANYHFIRNFGSIGSGDGQFLSIQQMRLDQLDNLYVLDDYLCRIQVFNKEGVFQKKWGEKGTQLEQLYTPVDFDFLNEKEILIVDSVYHDYENEDFNNTVKVFTIDGNFSRMFFSDLRYLTEEDDLYFSHLGVDKKGNVHLSVFGEPPIEEIDDRLSVIIKFSQQGEYISYFADFEKFSDYSGVRSLNEISITDNFFFIIMNDIVLQFSIPEDSKQPIQYIKTFLDEPDQFQDYSTIFEPSALFCTKQQILISDSSFNRLTIFDHEKHVLKVIQSSVFEGGDEYKDKNKDIPKGMLSLPEGVTIGPDNQIYVASGFHKTIKAFNPDGEEVRSFGKPYLDKNSEYGSSPLDIVFDKAGYCYVAMRYSSIICVYTKDYNPHLEIDIRINFDYFAHPVCLEINSDGNIVVGCQDYDDDRNILIYDISDIANKHVSLKENITIPEERIEDFFFLGINDIVMDEQDNMIVSGLFSSYLLWISKDGEITHKIDLKSYIDRLCKDGEGNIYVSLPFINSIWKLSSTGETIWQSNLGWFYLHFIAMDSKGLLYVSDPFHNVILVISDKTAVPPTPHDPKKNKTNASFYFQFNKAEITEDENITLQIMVKDFDLCSEIHLTIHYPSWLLQYQTVDIGTLFKETSFQILDSTIESNEISVAIKSEKGDIITDSGSLLDIHLMAIHEGSGLLNFTKLELKNPDGQDIQYKEKNSLRFIILPKDKTPPVLKISPIPKEVYEPLLRIKGETEPEATVKVNQQSVPVNPDGTFETEIILQKGENTISIIATDKAGNIAELTFQVFLKEKTIIQLFIGQSIIIVNDKTTTIDSEPFIDKNSGRTMVPLRAIGEAIGAIITFDPSTQRIDIKKDVTIIQLWIGKPKAMVNGVSVDIDPDKPVSPVIIKGRTFLPLRFIAEQLEFKVEWDAPTQRITLTYPK